MSKLHLRDFVLSQELETFHHPSLSTSLRQVLMTNFTPKLHRRRALGLPLYDDEESVWRYHPRMMASVPSSVNWVTSGMVRDDLSTFLCLCFTSSLRQ